jgi:hypothetical protein
VQELHCELPYVLVCRGFVCRTFLNLWHDKKWLRLGEAL